MGSVVRFNWPFYLVAAVGFACCIAGVFVAQGMWLRWGMLLMAAGSGYFIFVSLGVSHLIYDRSDLYRWRWLERVLQGKDQKRLVFCHSGFDEASQALGERFEGAEWRVLDHYDPVSMTEASIGRARKFYPPTQQTLASGFGSWPVEDGWADVVFGILAIHELRTVEERGKWFAEAKRCIVPDGRIVIVEHVRDPANFLAFGPGFLHFHSVEKWRPSWEMAGLRLVDGFRITPWIRVFVIGKP